jgi:hypothetical protein
VLYLQPASEVPRGHGVQVWALPLLPLAEADSREACGRASPGQETVCQVCKIHQWMRSSRVVRAADTDSQCRCRNCPRFDPSILRHSGILGVTDEAVLNIEYKKKNSKKSPFMQIQQAAPNLNNEKSLFLLLPGTKK